MPLLYPPKRHGRFGLAMGLTASLLHQRFGLDVGERFHHDILHRVAAVMEIDRLAWKAFGNLGVGFEEPFPRATIEPFGHRFIPVLYGNECVYSPGEEPAADFAEAARLFRGASANCILFPGWISAASPEEIEVELRRLMRAGLAFPRFTFSVFDVDPALAAGKIHEFHEIFRRCAESVSQEDVP